MNKKIIFTLILISFGNTYAIDDVTLEGRTTGGNMAPVTEVEVVDAETNTAPNNGNEPYYDGSSHYDD